MKGNPQKIASNYIQRLKRIVELNPSDSDARKELLTLERRKGERLTPLQETTEKFEKLLKDYNILYKPDPLYHGWNLGIFRMWGDKRGAQLIVKKNNQWELQTWDQLIPIPNEKALKKQLENAPYWWKKKTTW